MPPGLAGRPAHARFDSGNDEFVKHLPAIDGLRAVAVLAVVAYHAGLAIPAGFVGVDVFFVISGYVITRLLAAELPRIDFVGFYARRARRILPAMAVVVLATTAVSLALLPDAREAIQSAGAAGAFVANIFFQVKTDGYWAESAETMPLLHLWSLSVEEQFYLVWPLVLVLARRRPVAALWTLAIASFVLAEGLLWWQPGAAFYQMPARAWELAAGGLVALGAIRARHAWVGLAIVLLACVVPVPHFPGLGALPAVVGATWLIAAVHGGERVRVLEWKPMLRIGLVSYSLYLWHWPLLAIDRATRVGDAPLDVRLMLVAVAFVLAILSYRYIEQPVRRARWRPGRTVAVCTACVIAFSCTAFAMGGVRPPSAPATVVTFKRCPDDVSKGIVPPACIGRAPKVVIVGDSYAWSWEPLALAIAGDDLPVVPFARGACAPVAGVGVFVENAIESKRCAQHNARMLAYIEANGADTLILAGRWPKHFNDDGNAARGVRNFVQRAAPHAGRILIVGPTPEMRDDMRRCIPLGADCSIARAEFETGAARARREIAKLDAMPDVDVIDAAAWLCDARTCRDREDGHPLYRDANHVSDWGARAFAEHYVMSTSVAARTGRKRKRTVQ
jgi:peptidoglycan/LPS O-acetylase OafA/YrhL